MDSSVVDSTQFTGAGAVFGLILAHVRRDYWYSPIGSKSYETAKLFIEGGTCEHEGLVYEWGEWRDMIIGSLGIDKEGFIKSVKAGRRTE